MWAAKQALRAARRFAARRVQWGQPVGRHEAIAAKLARMAADIFALAGAVRYPCMLVDRGAEEIRLEAAIAKMFGSEAAWRIIDDAIQICGGRGYETQASLRARGEEPWALERALRDCRVNLIFEGSSEIMRLFIAREAMDPHMKLGLPLLHPRSTLGQRAAAAARMALFYARWYPARWFRADALARHRSFGPLGGHMRFVERAAHRLGRTVFHAMLRHRLALEKRQMLLGRLVEIGADLYCMSLACAYARALLARTPSDSGPRDLADLFCRHARVRVAALFRHLHAAPDRAARRLARNLLEGAYPLLEEGILIPADATESP